METLFNDLRSAFRSARRTPGITFTAIATFALGIGATTAVFSLIHGVLLRPLPYPDADRLVSVWEEHPGGTAAFRQHRLSSSTLSVWPDSSMALDGLGAYASYEMAVTVGDEPVLIAGSEVSPSVFPILRATAAIGRFFLPDESRIGAKRAVVISDRLWRTQFNSDPDVLSRSLVVDGESHAIVGVAQPSLEFPNRDVQFWLPFVPTIAAAPEAIRVFTAIGRLRDGVTPAQAAAEGTAAARSVTRPRSAELLFGKGGPVVVHVRPLDEELTDTIRPATQALAAGVGLLLLIACANVANLLLSKGLGRERELAIRLAVGASRRQLLQQLMTESAALSLTGGLVGLLLAWMIVRFLPSLIPIPIPRLEEVRIDAIVLAFSVLASLLVGIGTGLAPALGASRIELFRSVRVADSSPAGTRKVRRHLRYGLLVGEAALATILIVGAALLARSFVRLLDVDPGYTAEGVVSAALQMPRSASPEQTAQFIDATLERLRAMPPITAAGAGSMMPMTRMTAVSTVVLPDRLTDGTPARARSITYTVTPGYAEALGLRLNEGRLFAERDAQAWPQPVIVNEEFVRQYLGRRPVVGRALGEIADGDTRRGAEIVGVVGTVLKNGNDQRPEPEIYFIQQTNSRPIAGLVSIAVKTTGPPATVGNEVRTLVREMDRRVVIERIEPLTTLLSRSMDRPRFGLIVVTVFATLALALAAVGLYGVLSYNVSLRRRELGVRAALGADRQRLIGLVLREALAVTTVGSAIGLVAAGTLMGLFQTLLFGITARDVVSYASAPALLLAVALAAAIVPAWRAARTDPAVTLRN